MTHWYNPTPDLARSLSLLELLNFCHLVTLGFGVWSDEALQQLSCFHAKGQTPSTEKKITIHGVYSYIMYRNLDDGHVLRSQL